MVHAIKSSAKTIGATSTAETAAQLEEAANQQDGHIINDQHAIMMAQYQSVTEAIRDLLPEASEPSEDDREILEFMPE